MGTQTVVGVPLMVRVRSRYLSSLFVLAVAVALAIPTHAQSDKPDASSQPPSSAPTSTATVTSSQAQPTDEVDPLKRKPNEKQKKAQKRSLNVELSKTYKKWLNEDVVWIISDEERAAFKQLSNDEERDNFIEAFWQRRDPTPDTEENEYKEEHYRRIAYANE
ncbi:MAG TPA: GWxTD domain-containing protein, partial [Candidatus Polarisedimenticolia bacterium]|nr:GWxTD domain-containing protein [Candidatus Polarisedimenticolia bacterium]